MSNGLPDGWRVMRDSAHPELIPGTADGTQMVAPYVDGSFEWPADQLQRFESVPRPRITVEPFNPDGSPTGFPFGDYRKASIIDVETGAFSAADAARFVPARNRLHPDTATVYCNKFDFIQTVKRALRGRQYWLWLAWFIDHTPTQQELEALEAEIGVTVDGTDGVRLAAWQHTSGSRYDESAVFRTDWHGGS